MLKTIGTLMSRGSRFRVMTPSLRATLTLRAKREMRISSSPLSDLCNSSGAAGSLHKEENEELGTKDA